MVYSRRAYGKICAEVERAGGARETGGVLLGCRTPFISVVRDVTASCAVGPQANVEFVLDGELHTKLVQKTIAGYRIAPKLLGVWHSHVGTFAEFSEQDRKANHLLAQMLDRIFSSVVNGAAEPTVKTWHIAAAGGEKACRTIILKI